nr:transmembrane protein 128-like [Lytechinus pictus]
MQKKREEEAEAKASSPYNFQTVFWILSSIAIFKLTDFLPAILYNSAVNRITALYLIVVCSWIRKINDWEKHCPCAIPIATCSVALGLYGKIFLNIALWPVYGFLTPVFLFTLFMGFVVLVSLLPNSIRQGVVI